MINHRRYHSHKEIDGEMTREWADGSEVQDYVNLAKQRSKKMKLYTSQASSRRHQCSVSGFSTIFTVKCSRVHKSIFLAVLIFPFQLATMEKVENAHFGVSC